MNKTRPIHGYSFGMPNLVPSPISLADLQHIQASVLFDNEDVKYLRLSYPLVEPQVEAILDVWYGFVASQPHLLESFSAPATGAPLAQYLERVRKRFGQWILDTALANYDQDWLDYQHEIGLRHHRSKKNSTDGAESTAIVPFRNLFALIFPITFTLRPFLAKSSHEPQTIDRMHAAWVKSCLVQVTLWSYPYVKPGDF